MLTGPFVPASHCGQALIENPLLSSVEACPQHSCPQHSHVGNVQPVYPVHIEFVGSAIEFDVLQAVGAPLAPQGIIALIGRDVLCQCVFHYNGVRANSP